MVIKRRKSTRPIDVEKVIGSIDLVEDLDELTWDKLAVEVGYAERSLRRIEAIYDAFWTKKDKLATPLKGPKRRSQREVEIDTISYLKRQLEAKNELIKYRDETINLLRQAFVQLVINGQREGIDVERLWTVSVEKVLNERRQ